MKGFTAAISARLLIIIGLIAAIIYGFPSNPKLEQISAQTDNNTWRQTWEVTKYDYALIGRYGNTFTETPSYYNIGSRENCKMYSLSSNSSNERVEDINECGILLGPSEWKVTGSIGQGNTAINYTETWSVVSHQPTGLVLLDNQKYVIPAASAGDGYRWGFELRQFNPTNNNLLSVLSRTKQVHNQDAGGCGNYVTISTGGPYTIRGDAITCERNREFLWWSATLMPAKWHVSGRIN